MGIPGLMSYILNGSKFLRDYELHDTNLVIDGNNLIPYLYHANQCNYCFGGDYEKYAYFVNEYFDELLKCKITPLIVFDGGIEDKKLNTVLERGQARIANVAACTPDYDAEVLPILVTNTFKIIIEQKGIKSVHTIFEADGHIASIARILNCPVLSFDSDFFIYDILYIPIKVLKAGLTENSNGLGFVKKCKIYKLEYFLESFSSIDKKLLPLLAVLLGNDYLNSSLFNKFFSTLKISKKFKEQNSLNQQRLEALFRWMQNRSLNSAISTIVNTLDPEKRPSVIEVIEIIINGYLKPSSELLGPLRYSQKEIEALMQNISSEQYKFEYTDDFKEPEEITDDEEYLNCSRIENEKMLLPTADLIFNATSKIDINGILPKWFLKKFYNSEFPSVFIDMLYWRMIVLTERVSDLSQPPCMNISLKIISLLFKLLHNGITDFKTLKYVARGDSMKLKTYELNCDQYVFNFEIPTLQKLVDYPISKKREILTGTLGVDHKIIVEFPPAWRLYIATIKYWSDEADAAFKSTAHVYTLVLILIYYTIKTFIRNQSYFESMNTLSNNIILNNQEPINQEPDRDMPIKTALEKITKQDCILALKYFHSHKCVKAEEKFKIVVVHSFSLLQTCLKESLCLNALLGNPYPKPNVAELFNGILAYNMYNDIENKKPRFNLYIYNILKDSPSILQLFVSVSTKIQKMVKKN